MFDRREEPRSVADGLIDYDIYVMSKGEKVINIILAAAVLFAVGYIFYHNLVISALLMIAAIKWPPMRVNQIIAKRKSQLTLQFKELMYSLSSALSVGRSVETGLQTALQDLRIMYPDPDTYIIKEVEYILHGIGMNMTTEEMFMQFAARSHLEDIENFVDIFVTCKRTGGDLIEVMRSTSNTIGEKIEVKQEINTLMAGKKYEFYVLMCMPIVMVLFLSLTSGEYMAPVFDEIAGNIAMTVAIFIFAVAFFVGVKIMKIDV